MTGPARPLILAHRGDHRLALENSLAAVAAAIAMPGCNGVEIDVRAARDGTPVVAHDATLERTHRRPDPIAGLTPAELARFGIPSLQEVLDVLPASCILDLELKEDIICPVLQLLSDSARADRRTIVSSFAPNVLDGVRRHAPASRTWLNADHLDDGAMAAAGRARCDGVAVRWNDLEPAAVATAARAGLEVAAWTVTEPKALETLAAMGVVAICAEGPALGVIADPEGASG